MDQQAKIVDEHRLDPGRFQRRAGMFATVIELLLLEFPFFGLIIIPAALRRLHLTMRFTAAKRTAQILTPGISGMGNKKNTAVPASCQAGLKVWFLTQHQTESPVVLGYNSSHFATAIPVRLEFKKVLNLNYKKDRF